MYKYMSDFKFCNSFDMHKSLIPLTLTNKNTII